MAGFAPSGVMVSHKVLLTPESPKDVADAVWGCKVRPDRAESSGVDTRKLYCICGGRDAHITHYPYGSMCELHLPSVCLLLKNRFALILSFMTLLVNFGDTSRAANQGYYTKHVAHYHVSHHLRRRSHMEPRAAVVLRVLVLEAVPMSNVSGEYISLASNIWGTTV